MMIVAPRFMCGRAYFERKKKGWMFVLKVWSHWSLCRVSYLFLIHGTR